MAYSVNGKNQLRVYDMYVEGDLDVDGDANVMTDLWVNGDAQVADGADTDALMIIECDTSGTGKLRYVADADTSAEWGLSQTDDLCWWRYNPKGTYIGVGFAFDSSSGDAIAYGNLYSEDWQNYGGTSTVVGWSSRSYTNIYYKKIGHLIFVDFGISGTSNSTTITFSLPYTSDSGTGSVFVYRAYENGTYSYGLGQLDASDTTVEFWTAPNKPTWNSGGVTNAIFGQFWYNATA